MCDTLIPALNAVELCTIPVWCIVGRILCMLYSMIVRPCTGPYSEVVHQAVYCVCYTVRCIVWDVYCGAVYGVHCTLCPCIEPYSVAVHWDVYRGAVYGVHCAHALSRKVRMCTGPYCEVYLSQVCLVSPPLCFLGPGLSTNSIMFKEIEKVHKYGSSKWSEICHNVSAN